MKFNEFVPIRNGHRHLKQSCFRNVLHNNVINAELITTEVSLIKLKKL